MSNHFEVVRGTARTVKASLTNAAGTETIKFVLGKTAGQAGTVYSAPWNSTSSTFDATLNSTVTLAADLVQYSAVFWRTDSGLEDVPVADGSIKFVDVARTV